MGHYHEDLQGTGKNKQSALDNAIDEFIHENGHRYSYRGLDSATFVKKIPPMKWVKEQRGRTLYQYQKRDFNAPESEWLEVWDFVVHFHA